MGNIVGADRDDPLFVEEAPEYQRSGGNIRIVRNGVCRAVMPISVFEADTAERMRLIRDFHLEEGRNVAQFKPRDKAGSKH